MLVCLLVWLSVCLLVWLSVCLSGWLCIYQLSVLQFICLSPYSGTRLLLCLLSACLPVFLPARLWLDCLSVKLSVRLHACPSLRCLKYAKQSHVHEHMAKLVSAFPTSFMYFKEEEMCLSLTLTMYDALITPRLCQQNIVTRWTKNCGDPDQERKGNNQTPLRDNNNLVS